MAHSASEDTPLKKIPIFGKEHIPHQGVLVLPNQLDFLSLMHLETLLPERNVFYLVEEPRAMAAPFLSYLALKQSQVILWNAENEELVRQKVSQGAVVIFLPPHRLVQNASLSMLSGEVLGRIVQMGVSVLPLYVLHTNELAFQIDSGAPADDAMFCFGPVLEGASLHVAAILEVQLQLAEQAFALKPSLNWHLGYAMIKGLKKHGSSTHLIDGKDDTKWSFDKVLAAAIVLSKYVKKVTQKKRVGVILPPGFGVTVANLAILFAGKVPVNLNFTASREAVESAIRQADLDHYLTADLFVRKVQTFPWPPMKQLTFLERYLPTQKLQIAKWLILSKILPAPVLAGILGVPQKGGDKEAVLLFTSGSSGEPKGVALSHRNVLSNVCQFGSRLNMSAQDGILGSLPMFHSFGCTVTLWYPIIQGINVVTYPSPLETKKLAELIHDHNLTLMISTPTFLRSFMKGVNPELLTSLKMVVTGAEKLPKSVAESFEQKFNKTVLEGYGLTETSPATNVNLANLGEFDRAMPSYRFGSVGQMLPGMAVKITHLETDEVQPVTQTGMIWLKGCNVFQGYLNQPNKSREVLKDGWFRTGDIGRLDEDGFLYIEGRLSRFSKIGGEMVPHETVEAAIVKVLRLETAATRQVAVIGVPDPDRGEALVLLCAVENYAPDLLSLRHALLEQGVPALWIPKRIAYLPGIPVLASGKLDMKGCEQAASRAM